MLFLYKDPLLYVRDLKPHSIYVEHESTSVFEVAARPPLVVRQLQYLRTQQRYVTLVLVTGERIFGTVTRVEGDDVWLMGENGTLCVALNSVRAVR